MTDRPLTQKRAYIIFTLISVLFFGPFIFAWTYFFYGDHSSHAAVDQGIQKGQLLVPPLQLNELNLINREDGEAWNSDSLDRKWSLLLVSEDCAQVCEETFYQLRQIRLSFANDMRRVQRVLSTQKPLNDALYSQFVDEAGNTVITELPESSRLLLQQQRLNTKTDEGIYLLDPRGFVILAYDALVSSDDIYADLHHLLKYSQIG